MARYILTITQIGRTPAIDKTVHDGSDWKTALREYRGAVDRSQGEWTNHVYLGQTVTLYDSNMRVRHYVGSKDPESSIGIEVQQSAAH